jgi:hypothetical protein
MKNLPEILDQYFNWKTLTGALFFAAGLFAALLMLLWAFTPERPSRGVATAVLNIIPAPTATSPASQQAPVRRPRRLIRPPRRVIWPLALMCRSQAPRRWPAPAFGAV